MKDQLINLIYQANPWLKNKDAPLIQADYIPRLQTEKLLLAEWDSMWLVTAGPRQAGKTTLAKYISQQLINQKRFETLLYLNCDKFIKIILQKILGRVDNCSSRLRASACPRHPGDAQVKNKAKLKALIH